MAFYRVVIHKQVLIKQLNIFEESSGQQSNFRNQRLNNTQSITRVVNKSNVDESDNFVFISQLKKYKNIEYSLENDFLELKIIKK